MIYPGNELDAVNAATADFATKVTDPKAQILTTYTFFRGAVGPSLCFVDRTLTSATAGCVALDVLRRARASAGGLRCLPGHPGRV